MKKQYVATKKFVLRHRVAIAIVGTTTVLMTLQFRNTKALNEFLKEHDLFDTYYALDEI